MYDVSKRSRSKICHLALNILPCETWCSNVQLFVDITPHTVVWECCKDDQQSQWEMPYFGVCQHRNPWVNFQKKFAGFVTSGPHPTHKYCSQSVQRGRVCACVKLSPSGVYFFLFLDFMRLATDRPVGSLPLTAQMTRPGGHYVLLMVSLIK